MIVSIENFHSIISDLCYKDVLALDTETTGLRTYHGDKIFSVVIYDGNQGYYFNFNDMNKKDQMDGVVPLPRYLFEEFKRLFNLPHMLWILANAKYDMHMLANEGLLISGQIWDVLVMARIEYNDHFKYSLDECSKRIGLEKSKEVEEYIKQHRCYKKEKIPGKKGEHRNPQFWMVPLEIISRYGLTDVVITYKLFLHQHAFFSAWDKTAEVPIMMLVAMEMALTKVCFKMEREGILLDVEYCKKALAHEEERIKVAQEQFKKETGYELIDSYTNLKKSLGSIGVKGGTTEKGNASFKDDVLAASDHPACRAVLDFRDATKRSGSYYSSFLFHADHNSLVHFNIRQSATKTGRFAITEPALQTLNAEDDYTFEWRVRRAFIPPPEFVLVAVDYKAFEFRAMLDTAGERELADKITGGFDPHQATADLVNISRKEAKTLNFGLLYGMGAGKLAAALDITIDDAKRIKSRYFAALPKIRALIGNATYTAESQQRVVSRFGRVYYFPDPKWAYKALNALIQGGTADAIKTAMVRIDEYLALKTHLKSRIALQVHDELLLFIHRDEFFLIPIFVKIMEDAWPERFHKMSCSVEHSWKSWGDLEEGFPVGV